jgi:hypothetical protein
MLGRPLDRLGWCHRRAHAACDEWRSRRHEGSAGTHRFAGNALEPADQVCEDKPAVQ